jgi:hypothetical protein
MLQNLQTEKTKTTSSFFKIKIRVFPNFENDATMQVASSISQILPHTHTHAYVNIVLDGKFLEIEQCFLNPSIQMPCPFLKKKNKSNLLRESFLMNFRVKQACLL